MVKAFGAAFAAAAICAMPAQAACWTSEEASAASIREFQSMLMVATLRCQVAQHDMTADYNDFLRANRSVIQRNNDRIKAHFVKAVGPAAGQKAYDSFATHLANGYGGAGSSAETCGDMAALAREATLVAGDQEALLLLAARQGLTTMLPGGACTAPRPGVAIAAGAVAGTRAAGR